MSKFIQSLLLLICLIPFQLGCGEAEPLQPASDEPVEELDPESEAESLKKIK